MPAVAPRFFTRRHLQIVVAIYAVVPLLAGLGAIVGGPATLPGKDHLVDPTTDSEYRFVGSFWFGAAPVLWSAVRDIERHGARVRAVYGLVFLGGLTRLLAWRQSGRPHPVLVAAVGVELIGSPLLMAWLARIERLYR